MDSDDDDDGTAVNPLHSGPDNSELTKDSAGTVPDKPPDDKLVRSFEVDRPVKWENLRPQEQEQGATEITRRPTRTSKSFSDPDGSHTTTTAARSTDNVVSKSGSMNENRRRERVLTAVENGGGACPADHKLVSNV